MNKLSHGEKFIQKGLQIYVFLANFKDQMQNLHLKLNVVYM